MAERAQLNGAVVLRPLDDVLQQIKETIARERAMGDSLNYDIRDLRLKFDQVSAPMNQAIYNDQKELIHHSCLQTVAVLIEILARS